MDNTDQIILSKLRTDGRKSFIELGREEPTSPKTASGKTETVPEHHTRAWEIRVRKEALEAAKRDGSTGRRAGLPSSR